MSPLSPCPECSRHVRTSDATCPFCKAVLPAGRPERRVVAPRGLGRSALMAFGTVAVAGTLTVAGCGDDDGGTGPEDADIGGVDAAYGAPPRDSGPETDAAPPEDAFMGGVDAAYGGPPVDGGPDAGDDGGTAAAYGAPAYGAPP